MVAVSYSPNFSHLFRKIKDNSLKEKLKNQLRKIIENPEIGKPMKYARKGTREVYVAPFRLSYAYLKEEDKLVILDLYHKDRQ
ncbi:TPA: type II toxin-antitoxin system RelE/ParE family toxin [Candidatus Micrarchaeota archaeon]|nr:type II toxin-antitoxin system RelE/ParE family toxin [Candidatus Micrarchaeota archaeon]HIH29767.1 type II toxin-antitoxin system RelE/ParE family toxin [Candidatus Micrarchaeota archaeon]